MAATRYGLIRRPLLTIEAATHRIIAIEQYADAASLDRMPQVEFYDGVLCCGFVNVHCHLELSYLKGAIEEGCGHGEFARQMGLQRNKATLEERIVAAAAADRAMWEEGIDAVGDIVNSNDSFEVKSQSPIHYHSFVEKFGLRQPNSDICRTLLHYPETSLTPHSIYSLNDAEFRSAITTNDPAPLSIHFMESAAERELFLGKGSLYEWYLREGFECDFLGYTSPANRLTQCVPPTKSTILVHCTDIDQRDIEQIASHFTSKVYWALSPRSNRYISNCEPSSYRLLRQSGATICIGTDSLASNRSLSMVEELKLFKDVPLAELLQWATFNGAEALGISDRYGSLEEGRCSSLVQISGIDLSTEQLTEHSTARRII